MLNEHVALASIRTGDSHAFSDIIVRYQKPIENYLFRLSGDMDTAHDLAQDTFILAYKNILYIKEDVQIKAWLFRIATNCARQYFRRNKIKSLIYFTKLSKPDYDHDNSKVIDESLAVKETLNKLSDEKKICMVLHYVEGFKYKEIAEMLGISKDAVHKRVERGVEDFRRLYNSGGGGR